MRVFVHWSVFSSRCLKFLFFLNWCSTLCANGCITSVTAVHVICLFLPLYFPEGAFFCVWKNNSSREKKKRFKCEDASFLIEPSSALLPYFASLRVFEKNAPEKHNERRYLCFFFFACVFLFLLGYVFFFFLSFYVLFFFFNVPFFFDAVFSSLLRFCSLGLYAPGENPRKQTCVSAIGRRRKKGK